MPFHVSIKGELKIKIKEKHIDGLEGRCKATTVDTTIQPYIDEERGQVETREHERTFLQDESGESGYIYTDERIVEEGGYVHIKGGKITGKEVKL